MKLSTLVTDNITEVLIKILKFTQARQKVLALNINDMRNHGFMPKDLDVDRFSDVLNHALNEHAFNQRLVLCDTETIKFGIGGDFSVEPSDDPNAQDLLNESKDEYIELQINKLLENSLNQKVATELLKQKHGMVSIFE